jgi:hypothetical protein
MLKIYSTVMSVHVGDCETGAEPKVVGSTASSKKKSMVTKNRIKNIIMNILQQCKLFLNWNFAPSSCIKCPFM